MTQEGGPSFACGWPRPGTAEGQDVSAENLQPAIIMSKGFPMAPSMGPYLLEAVLKVVCDCVALGL